MPHVLDRLGVALLDASLAAVAITGLVVLAMVQSRQPARRLGWARAGLVSSLVLLPLSVLNPVPRLDLRGPLGSLWHSSRDGSTPGAPGVVAGGDPVESTPACHEPGGGIAPPTGPRWPRGLARGLVLGHAAGVSIGLGSIVLGLWGSAWLVRQAWPASDRSSRDFDLLPFQGASERPRLLVSDRVTRAVLVGIIRPTILIPPELDEPESADRRRLSLLHELAHAEAADHRFGPAASLASAVWFFLPPVWWIRDQMRLDQEFLADRRAVGNFGPAGGYASSLVELAASLSSAPEPAPSPAAGRGRNAVPEAASALFQRVLMLVKCPFAIEGKTPLWWRWSTALTLGLTTLAASCLTLRGMAGWSNPAASSPSAGIERSIRLPQLVITGREDYVQPFDLRLRLPDEFSLTFEVMAEPDDLPSLEVLGHPLGPGADPDPTRRVYRLWHRVEIRRRGPLESLRVDDQPVVADLKSPKAASWLTIRPLRGRPTRIRDLELSW